ncbi:MAG: substrate-binding domain-containing protein [Fimbriimonadaceae bacterium]|nr:substrate-binding domain-containing protein [Chitinophagales bacterium]
MLILFSAACKQKENNKLSDFEYNFGAAQITCDENYKSLTDELIKSYENVFDSTDIEASYVTEQDAIDLFLKDSIQLMMIGRNLSEAELNNASITQGLRPKQNIIAYEAIAVIASTEMPDSIFDLDAFIQNSSAGVKNKYTDTKFIFENAKSGTLAYLFNTTGLQQPSTQNMFAVDSLEAFMQYLKTDKNAIGFLSFAQLSDNDDPVVKDILKEIKILKVVHTDTTGVRMIAELSQSTIATKEYPLVRPINVVVGNISERVGMGFVNFLYKQKSARIFLKAGLIPSQIPERQILINED